MTFELYQQLLWGWIAIGILIFVALFFIDAPYGRHSRKGWGPTVPARYGWILMESPSALLMIVYYFMYRPAGAAPLILLLLWEFHYIYRTYYYPFTLKGRHASPVSIVLFGVVFNAGNTFFNGQMVFNFMPPGSEWLGDPRLLLGATLFIVGSVINRRADAILRSLQNGTEYKIPRGWLYEKISCPNYLGEILIWCGWALAVWNLAGLSFALWTIANLAPRAWAHHKWYNRTFDDYPAVRKALIPGLL